MIVRPRHGRRATYRDALAMNIPKVLTRTPSDWYARRVRVNSRILAARRAEAQWCSC